MRYRRWHLEGLTDEEALEAVYNYAYSYQVAVTDETAPYIAAVCDNDPFYIAAVISNLSDEKDLTTEQGVRDALTFETVTGQGEIAHTWGEYLEDAFDRVNEIHARRIVLYLAKHEPEEKNRDQIRQELKLEMTDEDLAKRLDKLVMADILAQGSSKFSYQGLGDRVFAMVFRRLYGTQIDRVSVAEIDEDFKRELASLKGLLSVHKGAAAEYRVRYRLLVASLRGAALADIVQDSDNLEPALAQRRLGPFAAIRKAHFFVDLERNLEVDLHAVHEDDDGTDLMIEVKDWEREAAESLVRRFVEIRQAVVGQLRRPTVFLFYSERGLSEAAALREADILVLDPKKLAGFETF